MPQWLEDTSGSHSTILAATTIPLLTVNVARADDAAATTEPTTTTADGAVVTEDGAPVPPTEEAPGAEFGVGIRLRNVRLPQGIFELFVETAAGASSRLGIGVDLVRRRENFELQIGLEYEKIGAPAGIWVEKDKPIPANQADFVEFNDFGWFRSKPTLLAATTSPNKLRCATAAVLASAFCSAT